MTHENHTLIPTMLGDDSSNAQPSALQPIRLDSTCLLEALGAGDSAYRPSLLSRPEADEALAMLMPEGGEIVYQQWHAMPNRKKPNAPLHPLRRLKIAMATPDPVTGHVPHYRFPVNNQHRHGVVTPMTPTVDAIRARVEAATGVAFNHAVVLLYRDGNDCIGFHKDKMLDLDPDSPIVSVSLGAVRTYVLRDDIFNPTVQYELPLGHGSLLVLGPKSNEALYHSVRKPSDEDLARAPSLQAEVRISLTFRKVATFADADARLHGQGAEHPSLNWPEALRGSHRLE